MTETQTVDLASWLTQIWDEEAAEAEAAAREVASPQWTTTEFADYVYTVTDENAYPVALGAHEYMRDELRYFIARHDPASVLARIAADRKILELHQPDRVLENWYWLERKCQECGHPWQARTPIGTPPTVIGSERGCPTVRLLASPYKEREGWQEAWRV